VIARAPLDADDHLIDAGCGTGKLAALVARGYPRLGRITLLEPNAPKLERAVSRDSARCCRTPVSMRSRVVSLRVADRWWKLRTS
jgi:ubiquinone/menaquinone biosynthesis C-methylase UbiE